MRLERCHNQILATETHWKLLLGNFYIFIFTNTCELLILFDILCTFHSTEDSRLEFLKHSCVQWNSIL